MNKYTILWISSSRNSYTTWGSVFKDSNIAVLRVNELELTLNQVAYPQLDLVLLEAGGILKDDIDLCYRLRKRFDIPLMLITTNVTEAFAVAAYRAGVDECILGHVSPDLLRAKVRARLQSIERLTSEPESQSPPSGHFGQDQLGSPIRIGHRSARP